MDGPRMISRMAGMPATTTGIKRLAYAISVAEGYWLLGSVPNRARNPGDLKVPGWLGSVTGAENIPIFDNVEDGWNALYHQLQVIIDGTSHAYDLDMSIRDVGLKWTDSQRTEWAENVAVTLDLPISTPLRAILLPDSIPGR